MVLSKDFGEYTYVAPNAVTSATPRFKMNDEIEANMGARGYVKGKVKGVKIDGLSKKRCPLCQRKATGRGREAAYLVELDAEDGEESSAVLVPEDNDDW